MFLARRETARTVLPMQKFSNSSVSTGRVFAVRSLTRDDFGEGDGALEYLLVEDVGFEGAADGFDFGEFGH